MWRKLMGGLLGRMTVVLLVAVLVTLVACSPAAVPTPSPGKPPPTAPPAATATKPAPSPSPTREPSAAKPAEGTSISDFHGIPLPKGANRVQEFSWQMMAGPQAGQLKTVEWSGYKVGQEPQQIISFYKSEMPKRGWTQSMWVEGSGQPGEMAWGMYSKGDQEMAGVYVLSGEEDFNLVLFWGQGKQ